MDRTAPQDRIADEDDQRGRVDDGDEFPGANGNGDDTGPTFDDERREAVDRVTKATKADPKDLADATAWFLSDERSPLAVRTFGLNVGKWNDESKEYEDFVVNWTVQALSREAIRTIQKMAVPARERAKGTGEMDSMKANLGIAAEGTVKPDLAEIAASVGSQDTAEVLKRRFAYKPGLIDQIANEVLTVSGYNDDDVRDVSAVRD